MFSAALLSAVAKIVFVGAFVGAGAGSVYFVSSNSTTEDQAREVSQDVTPAPSETPTFVPLIEQKTPIPPPPSNSGLPTATFPPTLDAATPESGADSAQSPVRCDYEVLVAAGTLVEVYGPNGQDFLPWPYHRVRDECSGAIYEIWPDTGEEVELDTAGGL